MFTLQKIRSMITGRKLSDQIRSMSSWVYSNLNIYLKPRSEKERGRGDIYNDLSEQNKIATMRAIQKIIGDGEAGGAEALARNLIDILWTRDVVIEVLDRMADLAEKMESKKGGKS